MIDRVETAVRKAFQKLITEDGELFECPIEEREEDIDYDPRKLHEVCINHKLSIYLEEFLCADVLAGDEKFYTDIEFNKEGTNPKDIEIKGKIKTVRPDIIIHNRKTGDQKKNFLVAECKKDSASEKDKQKDVEKIEAFLTDEKYKYNFGLQVIYSNQGVSGTLFSIDEENIIKYCTIE